MKELLKRAGLVLLLLAAVRGILAGWAAAPSVPEDYTGSVATGGPVEAAYLAMGSYEVACTTAAAPQEEWGDLVMYYPAELPQSQSRYPVVVIVNGTGVGASKYPSLFEHLASWGFIVLGSDDPGTYAGDSAEAALTWLLEKNADPDSVFYDKADLDRVGACGHSQGGVGVFNAIGATPHKELYQCAVSLSPIDVEVARALKMPYDPAGIRVPVLILASASKDVIQMEGLQQLYDRIDAPKVLARRKAEGHGEMLYSADGYVTAWFMWQLQGDERAAAAFTGPAPELLANPLYQDQRIDL